MTLMHSDHGPAELVYAASARIGLVGRCRQTIRQWQLDRDLAAIVAALARLSDRRLALIGMRRGDLIGHVEHMMDEVEAGRRIEREVLEFLAEQGDKFQDHHPAPAQTAEICRIG